MVNVGPQLAKIIESEGLNVKKWCEKHGFTYSNWSEIVNGKRTMGINLLEQFLEVYPNVDLNWFLLNRDYQTHEFNIIPGNATTKGKSDPFERVLLEMLEREPIKTQINKMIDAKMQAVAAHTLSGITDAAEK